MANEEHVEKLRQGTGVWNPWALQNIGKDREIKVADLSGANLTRLGLSCALLKGANMALAKLDGTDLGGAELEGANLSQASLERAVVNSANLRSVNFTGAMLVLANFYNSDLSAANLTRAFLTSTNFHRARLCGAKLGEAYLYSTSFGETDLSSVQGLEECNHLSPCFIDLMTVEMSGGLPETFLRGCGWPDWHVEAAKLCQRGLSNGQITDITYAIANKLTSNPFTYYSCFISHSHADKPFARWLHDQLQARGGPLLAG